MKALLRHARLSAEWWLVLVAALVLAALAVRGQWTARLDFAAYDFALRHQQPGKGDDTLIVAIDDASLAAFGAWPWPRETQARLVGAIAAARPRALGLDILLSEARGETGDAALADALAGARAQGLRVVLPVAFRVPGSGGAAFGLDAPLRRFAGPDALTGHVNLSPDRDGVIRRFHRLYRSGAAQWRPLPEVMLRPSLRDAPAPPARQHALIAAQPLLIGYAGPPGTIPTISAAAILRGEVPASLIAGRNVLLGVTASGLGDYHAVPTGSGSLMAGVEIQANVLATLRGAHPVRPAPPLLAYLFALVPLTLLLVAMRLLPPRLTGPAAALLALGVALGTWALLRFVGLWLSPVTALAALALAWPLWAWRRLAVAGRFIARELERTAAHAGPLPTADATGLSFLDRQLALLDAAAARERQLRAEHDEVIRLLSHDMRSPQGAILSALAAHGDGPLPPEEARRIADHARRTLALSDGFVHLSRAQMVQFEPVLTDLAELARDAADALWEQSRDRAMPLEVFADGEVLVSGDPAMLHRMIVNLAENALKYGTPGTPVRLHALAADDMARIDVINAGPDIPPDRQAELFERFSRAGLETTRTPGVGLGLSFVHVAARRHGGTAECRSTGGETRFSAVLPLAR